MIDPIDDDGLLTFIDDDEPLTFIDENEETTTVPIGESSLTESSDWKVLLVDDDTEVHEVTRLALSDFRFEDKGLMMISAYSAQEAKTLLQAHSDIALILLDVVMESNEAGLTLVKYIRQTLENQLVRIVLRTGQPGYAPEKTVIVDYDINDYKTKTELTTRKLFTTVVAALRSFRDLIRLDQVAMAHREAEVRLRESEARNQAMINAIPDFIFRISREGVYLDFKGAIGDKLLLPPDEFLGKNLQDVLPKTLAQKRMEHIELALQTGEVQVFEYQFAPRGIEYTFEDRVVKSGSDEVLTVTRNVTDRKLAELEQNRLLTIDRELSIARDIQQSLLLPPNPGWSKLDVACFSTPAREVMGDLYAYHQFAGTKSATYALVVGDVSGKGIPASLLMAVSLASFQSIVEQALPPAQLLAWLDKIIALYTRQSRQNCALIYAEIDAQSTPDGSNEDGQIRIANAGCVTPLIRREDDTVEWVDIGGLPLGTGLGTEMGYQEVTLNIGKGDIVVLTSDGVIEAQNAENSLFGFERLEQAVQTGPTASAQAMLDHIRVAVDQFVDSREAADDLTLIVVKM
ncbi:MAG: SpoIIE family protein phosphatase [Chloroflexota bacterium]